MNTESAPRYFMRKWQFSLKSVLLLPVGLALALGVWSLYLQHELADSRKSMATRLEFMRPIRMDVKYVISSIDPQRSRITGTSYYTFKNDLEVRVKVAFPPIAYLQATENSLTKLYFPKDVSRMPRFCQTQQIVVFEPHEKKVFTSHETWIGTPFRQVQEEFIFGNPYDSNDEELWICAVVGNVDVQEWER